jgi:hypothetical protein
MTDEEFWGAWDVQQDLIKDKIISGIGFQNSYENRFVKKLATQDYRWISFAQRSIEFGLIKNKSRAELIEKIIEKWLCHGWGPLRSTGARDTLFGEKPFEISAFATSCIAAGVDIIKIWGAVNKSFKIVTENQIELQKYEEIGSTIEAAVLKYQTEIADKEKKTKKSI